MAARAWMHGLAFTLFLTLGAEAESSTSPVADHCRPSDDNLRQAIIEVHDKQRNVGLAVVVMRSTIRGAGLFMQRVPIPAYRQG